jgi:DNA-binding transcriptional LysR family regulator
VEYLVAVAEEASFTRAAGRVHISQSGVSAQVRQLEHELGAEPIDRSGRAATLTPSGTAALGHAREALTAPAVAELLRHCRRAFGLNPMERGVHITPTTVTSSGVPAIVAAQP